MVYRSHGGLGSSVAYLALNESLTPRIHPTHSRWSALYCSRRNKSTHIQTVHSTSVGSKHTQQRLVQLESHKKEKVRSAENVVENARCRVLYRYECRTLAGKYLSNSKRVQMTNDKCGGTYYKKSDRAVTRNADSDNTGERTSAPHPQYIGARPVLFVDRDWSSHARGVAQCVLQVTSSLRSLSSVDLCEIGWCTACLDWPSEAVLTSQIQELRA